MSTHNYNVSQLFSQLDLSLIGLDLHCRWLMNKKKSSLMFRMKDVVDSFIFKNTVCFVLLPRPNSTQFSLIKFITIQPVEHKHLNTKEYLRKKKEKHKLMTNNIVMYMPGQWRKHSGGRCTTVHKLYHCNGTAVNISITCIFCVLSFLKVDVEGAEEELVVVELSKIPVCDCLCPFSFHWKEDQPGWDIMNPFEVHIKSLHNNFFCRQPCPLWSNLA